MTNSHQWVAFRVAGQSYGLPISGVREIVRAPEITPVPKSPPHLCGVTNLRGRIIPVVDLRRKLGFRDLEPGAANADSQMLRSEPSSKARVLVVTVDGRFVGLLVEEASEVLKIAPAEIEAGHALFADDADGYVAGIAKHQGRLVVLLDIEKLLNRDSGVEIAESHAAAPGPESRIASPESRVPNSEFRVPSPETRVPNS